MLTIQSLKKNSTSQNPISDLVKFDPATLARASIKSNLCDSSVLVEVTQGMLFSDQSNDGSTEIWLSDGFLLGTKKLKMLGSLFTIGELHKEGGRAYILNRPGYNAEDVLWLPDGTVSGIYRVGFTYQNGVIPPSKEVLGCLPATLNLLLDDDAAPKSGRLRL